MPIFDPSIPAILMSSHHPSQPLYLRVRYGVSSQVCPTSLWLPEWEEIFMDRTCYLVPIRTLSVLSKYSLFNFLKDPSDTARIIVLTYTPSSWGTVSLTSPVEATVTSVQSLQYRVSCNYIIKIVMITSQLPEISAPEDRDSSKDRQSEVSIMENTRLVLRHLLTDHEVHWYARHVLCALNKGKHNES